MSALSVTATGTGVALSFVVLFAAQPDGTTNAAVMQAQQPTAAIDATNAAQTASADAARGSAETARHQVAAVEAERAAAVLAAAAAEAEARRKAEQEAAARQAELAAAARKAQRETAPAPAPAPAAPSRTRTADTGIAASAYTGPLYDEGSEATRRCIVRKESGGNYGVVSRNGTYHGAYQFLRSTSDATARRMGRPDLVGTPASTWSRHDQDMAFWTLWNKGSGRRNWPTAVGC